MFTAVFAAFFPVDNGGRFGRSREPLKGWQDFSLQSRKNFVAAQNDPAEINDANVRCSQQHDFFCELRSAVSGQAPTGPRSGIYGVGFGGDGGTVRIEFSFFEFAV